MPDRNTLVQLLAVYTNPESHDAQRHSQTDRRTDGQQDDANSRSYCVAVRSAKNRTARLYVRTHAYNIVLVFNQSLVFNVHVACLVVKIMPIYSFFAEFIRLSFHYNDSL